MCALRAQADLAGSAPNRSCGRVGLVNQGCERTQKLPGYDLAALWILSFEQGGRFLAACHPCQDYLDASSGWRTIRA